MSWIQFLLWMLGIYLFYYTSVLSFDIIKQVGKNGLSNANTIYFSPEIVAEIIKDISSIPDGDEIDYFIDVEESEPATFSSGGVSLKELFELAKNESIEFTRQVSF